MNDDNSTLEDLIEEDGKYFYLYKSGQKVEVPKAVWDTTKLIAKDGFVLLEGENNPHLYKEDGKFFIQPSTGPAREIPEQQYNHMKDNR